MKKPATALCILVCILSAGCGSANDPADVDVPSAVNKESPDPGTTSEGKAPGNLPEEPIAEPLPAPNLLDSLPRQLQNLWEPWTGDLEGIIERRALRVLVPFGGYQYYFVGGEPRGAVVELLQKMELFLNEELERRHVRIFVVPIPVSRHHLIPYLLEGHADLVAADLTVTEERAKIVTFSRPLLKNISEILVTGPAAPTIADVSDLSGHEIVVRKSSSYHEHLLSLSANMIEEGLEPPHIALADELLEAEDLLEMVSAGMIPMTVLDDYKAEFWASVFDGLNVRDDVSINRDGEIAWAMNPAAPELAKFVERFLRKYGRGTLVGNDTFNRYLADASRVRCVMTFGKLEQESDLAHLLRFYGEEYDFDWLKLAAQGYQESRLTQSKRSAAGALGVMQIKPSTASDPNVGIGNISELENNIHAGVKYMRFVSDRYFADLRELDRWLFSLAAYNAGPARVARLRREAAKNGLDRNRWFGNVEIIAARRIGRETVTYVSNIYKYYVGYKMSEARLIEQRRRYPSGLTECADETS